MNQHNISVPIPVDILPGENVSITISLSITRTDPEHLSDKPSLQDIKTLVSEALNVKLDTKCRKTTYTFPRYIYMKLAKQYKYTYSEIGQSLNGMDHTTIIHGISEYENLKQQEHPDIMRLIKAITPKINVTI